MRGHAVNGITHDTYIDNARVAEFSPKRGMVLPFTPLSMSFDDVNYHVDMPAVSSFFFFFLLLVNSQTVLDL